jgi:hypothetical protein
LKLPKDITLADDDFNIPGKTDMLIGSDISLLNEEWTLKMC